MYNWTKEKLDYLKENYGKIPASQIAININISHDGVRYKAIRMGLKSDLHVSGESVRLSKLGKSNKRWSENELNILKMYYENSSIEKLIELIPDRSESGIREHANSLGLVGFRRTGSNYKSLRACKATKLDKLLEDSPETYYWLGFLMADGHFTSNRISLTISIKDLEHIVKFANYIGLDKSEVLLRCNQTKCGVYPSHKNTVTHLIEKFNIHSNKTYVPCDISSITDSNLLYAFCVGFIDGDGHISKNGDISITLHGSWLKNLNYISQFLLETERAYIGNNGYATLSFSRKNVTHRLKEKIAEFKLPVLDRKWCRVF